jgi:hypothetical protein
MSSPHLTREPRPEQTPATRLTAVPVRSVSPRPLPTRRRHRHQGDRTVNHPQRLADDPSDVPDVEVSPRASHDPQTEGVSDTGACIEFAPSPGQHWTG